MLPIESLQVIKPHRAAAGTVLLGAAHRDRPPMFTFSAFDQIHSFNLSPTHGFSGIPIATNLPPYLVGGPATLLVDIDSKINPQSADIESGSAVLIGDKPGICIRLGYGTGYVSTAGTLIEDPNDYDAVAAFRSWKLVTPGFRDEIHVVYERTAS